MKIALIAPPWIAIPPKNYGGTENVVYELVEELVGLRHEVTLFTTEDSHTSAKQVCFLPKSLLSDGVPWDSHLKAAYHFFKSIEYVQKHTFDIVHTHLSSTSDMYIFPASTTLKKPHITTLHSNFPFDHTATGWFGNADKYYMDWAPSVPMVAISKSAAKSVEEEYPVKFVDVVYNGISMEAFKPSSKRQDNFFVWLGRFMPEKGAHLAIEAAKRTNSRLILAGFQDRNIKEAVAYFQNEIKPQIDGQQIKYFGPANAKQKISLFSRARAFLNPIEWEEPFGMVMIEAMATGCPVISFARGAAPEIIESGKTGFLVDTLDEMVERIARLDEIKREEVRKHIEQNFSAKVMANHYVEVYQKVIEQAQGAKPKKISRKDPALAEVMGD